MLLQEVTQLGFKEKEAKVYLALFEIGEAPALAIAKKATVNRPTTYFYLEELKKKGLARMVRRHGKTLFFAAPPQALRKYLQQRTRAITDIQKKLRAVAPELEALYQQAEIKPKIKLFEGRQGLLSIYEDLSKVDPKKDGEIFTFTSRTYVLEQFPDMVEKMEEERAKRGVWIRAIYSKLPGENLLPHGEDKKYRRTFVTVPSGKFPFSGSVHIYQNKVAFIALRRKLIGVLIENANVADTYRTIFRLAWAGALKLQTTNA